MAKLRVDKIASVGVSTETTGSVFFDGTSDGLRSDAYDELTLGTGAFTIECWFWRQNITDSWGSLVSDNLYSGAGGWDLYTRYNDIHFYVGGVGEVFEVSDCYSAQTWTHVAAQRDSAGNMSCYINGVNQNVSASNSTDYTDNRILIGGNNSPAGSYPAYVFNGYISNVRVCRGHTVYTSNFSVPTRELEVHPGPSNDKTIFLACYDGENVFAEKTGKIIAANGDRLSSPTPTATDSPIGITTENPGLTRDVDNTFGPVFQGGAGYASQNWLTLPKGTTTDRFPNFAGVDAASARGVFMGGGNTPRVNTIDYVTISTLGDATDFGDISAPSYHHTGGASNTRGIIGGGLNPANTNLIEYIVIQSTGNTKDFGDLSSAIEQMGGASNSTRCLFAGGYTTEHVNTIDFITISTSGNAFDFGDLTATKRGQGGLASPNRALFAAGANPGVSVNIDYVTIMSTGNAVDFGDISGSGGRQGNNGCSTNTRGCWGGGYDGPAGTDAIQYVTIATLGNAQPFGDLSVATFYSGATSSSTRGVWGGGYKPAVSNTIEYITMATLGDANNFGDLSQARVSITSVSNGHGGLG